MEVTFEYLLKANIAIIALFCFYKLCLERYNQLQWNRLYLLLGTFIAVFLPLVVINEQYPNFNHITQKPNILPTDFWENYNKIYSVISMMYWFVVGFFTVKLVLNFIQALKIKDFTNKNIAPHVFLNEIFIPIDTDPDDIIFEHENAHASQWHSLDVLFYELIDLFFWYNPFVYFTKMVAKNNHEYLADRTASQKLGNKKAYAQLLVSSYFDVKATTLNHHFYQKAGIKQRLAVLAKPNHYPFGKLVFVISFVLMALLSSFLPQKKPIVFTYQILIKAKNIQKYSPSKKDFIGYKVLISSDKFNTILNNGTVFQKANFDGGDTALQDYVQNNLIYSNSLVQAKIKQNYYMKLTIEPNGKVSNINFWPPYPHHMDAKIKAMFNQCSQWIPEFRNGKFISSQVNICIEIDPANL